MTHVSAPAPAREILTDVFTRVHEALATALDGLGEDALTWRLDEGANPVGWLAWHLTRIQDDHLAALGEVEQAWTSQGWADRFALPYAVSQHGFGHSSEQVAAWHGTVDLLVGYHQAATDLTLEVVAAMDDAAYERVVDEQWDPPVTAAARIVSVVNEVNQHLGQVSYVRGLLERR